MGPKSRVNHYNQSTNTPQSVSTYGTNAYKEQFLLFIHPINTTLSPKNDWNNKNPPQGVLCIVSLKFFKNHEIFLGKVSQLTLIWQPHKASMEESKYLRRLGPSTQLKPTGSCVAADSVLDPQSAGYIGNTRVYTYIYIFICKQYMTKAYTPISFYYMLILSWVFFFLLVIVFEGIPSSIRPRIPPKKELERHRSGVLNGIIPPAILVTVAICGISMPQMHDAWLFNNKSFNLGNFYRCFQVS